MNYLDRYSVFNDLSPEGRRQSWRAYDLHFAAMLPSSSDARILDIGCGAGLLLEWLSQRMGFVNVTGIDIDGGQVGFAREIGQNALLVEDVVSWLATQPAFHTIFMTDVLEHVTDREVAAYLEAIRCNLNDDGVLIIRVPNALSPTASWSLFHDPTHLRLYTVESLVGALRDAGFANVEIIPSESWRPASIKESLLLLSRACLRLVKRLEYRLELGRALSTHPLSQNLLAVAHKRTGYGQDERRPIAIGSGCQQ